MNHANTNDAEDHGPSMPLVRSDVGSVSMCSCGAITLTLQYLSLRFEPGAFVELQALLSAAQRRLDHGAANKAISPDPADVRDDIPNMH